MREGGREGREGGRGGRAIVPGVAIMKEVSAVVYWFCALHVY